MRLELATVALRGGDLVAAAAALEVADPQLEVIDLTRDDAGEVASWLFADAARPYRTPPWEKLMVNTLGMASRLAAGDAAGALVEARRFEVVARFFRDRQTDPGRVLVLGQLLAAAAHRAAGQPQGARIYDAQARAAAPGWWAASAPAGAWPLAESFGALAWVGGLERAWGAASAPAGVGELVVVVLAGRVPAKVAQRVDVHTAEQLAVQPGAAANLGELGVKELTLVGLGPAPAGEAPAPPGVRVAGREVATLWTDLAATARASFDAARPTLARAAITRALSRQAVRRTLAATDGRGAVGGQPRRRALGGLLGDLIAGSMEVTDTPDTRAWSTLPARLGVARATLPVGRHTVVVGDREVAVVVRAGLPSVAVVVLGAVPAAEAQSGRMLSR